MALTSGCCLLPFPRCFSAWAAPLPTCISDPGAPHFLCSSARWCE
jgi:hypothetical protein